MVAEPAADISSCDEPVAALSALSPAVREAWEVSFLAHIPAGAAQRLLSQAREARMDAGDVFYRGAYHGEMAMLALVVEGQLRIYRQTGAGRQVTMLYHYPGAVVGAPALVLGGTQHDGAPARQPWLMLGGGRVYGEAVRDTVLLRFSTSQFLQMVRTDAAVAWPLARYLAQRATMTQQMLTDDMFLSVRARVARHLIDLAAPVDGVLAVAAGHQEIADAIGSVREVATRALLDMRRTGLIERRDGQIILTDVDQLRLIASIR